MNKPVLTIPKPRRTLHQKAAKLVKELNAGDFPEDLEPQELAWLIQQLLKYVPEDAV